MEQRSRSFQKGGWNIAGSRLLAVSSWIAQQNEVKAKRKFADIDVFLVLVLVSLAIRFLTNSTILLLLVFLSVSYFVKKLVTKLGLEDLLETLSRDSQKLLVLQLMDFCELHSVDPENISDLSRCLHDEQTSEKMLLILLNFVSKETKYYILKVLNLYSYVSSVMTPVEFYCEGGEVQ